MGKAVYLIIDYGEGLHLSSRTKILRVVDCQKMVSGLRDSLRMEATPGKHKDMAKRGKRSRIPGTT